MLPSSTNKMDRVKGCRGGGGLLLHDEDFLQIVLYQKYDCFIPLNTCLCGKK